MSFLVYLLCGVFGGLLGGMGMGGGTALIPLLVFCGVKQTAAQGINLLSFIPMSALALAVHARSGLLEKKGLLQLITPALLFSVFFSLLAAALPAAALKKGFGAFLILLSFFQFRAAFRAKSGEKCPKKVFGRKKYFPKGYGQSP